MGDDTTELAPPALVVLVVEDEALILGMVVSALEGAGYSVRVAASGIEAMTVMDDQAELRALVTDVDLGEGPNGWDVAKRARERAPTIPVIYVTGGSQADWSANGVRPKRAFRGLPQHEDADGRVNRPRADRQLPC